ncbi:MAG: hypothetical protein WC875_03455 [Candidatus Absconditabacterales bacterium]
MFNNIQWIGYHFTFSLLKTMEVSVYNAEKFQRNKWRYVIFATIFAGIFILSIFNQNYVGAILIFFLLGGYFYYSAVHAQVITMRQEINSLKIGNAIYPRSTFVGYVLEMDAKTQILKNIVFISSKGHTIYTFHDTPEHIRNFVLELDNYLPMMETYDQTNVERMIRRMKL